MPLPTRHKKKKPSIEIDIDGFIRFGLQYKDFNGEPFFILDETKLVQNYKCVLNSDQLLSSYRNYLK